MYFLFNFKNKLSQDFLIFLQKEFPLKRTIFVKKINFWHKTDACLNCHAVPFTNSNTIISDTSITFIASPVPHGNNNPNHIVHVQRGGNKNTFIALVAVSSVSNVPLAKIIFVTSYGVQPCMQLS